MFRFPFGIKTKHTIHKKIIIKCQQNPFEKELKEFNESNHIHVPKRTSRDKKEKKEKKNKTGKRKYTY
jgi:hypothetical protein